MSFCDQINLGVMGSCKITRRVQFGTTKNFFCLFVGSSGKLRFRHVESEFPGAQVGGNV